MLILILELYIVCYKIMEFFVLYFPQIFYIHLKTLLFYLNTILVVCAYKNKNYKNAKINYLFNRKLHGAVT